LLVFDAATGKKVFDMRLTFMPVRDGMAAAGGILFFSGQDGAVYCFK